MYLCSKLKLVLHYYRSPNFSLLFVLKESFDILTADRNTKLKLDLRNNLLTCHPELACPERSRRVSGSQYTGDAEMNSA